VSGLILADVRGSIADYVGALITVYIIIIIAYVVVSWVQMLGGRIPYNRWLSAVIGFINEVSQPYLRIWRRLIPPFGGIDLSPTIGIFVLIIVGPLIANAIRG
jgi:YggT family protein